MCSLMHIWVIVAFCCILLYFVAFCCILLYFVTFCCTLVEREVSEWGRPQLPSAPPWPHHSSTSVVVVIVIVVVVVVLLISLKHQLCSVEARIPISRMRNPEIISVSCQITNCSNILKLSTLPTFSCLCEFVFFPQNIPSNCFCHCCPYANKFWVYHENNLRCFCNLSSWDTEWENICEGVACICLFYLDQPVQLFVLSGSVGSTMIVCFILIRLFVCFIWISWFDHDSLSGEQMRKCWKQCRSYKFVLSLR